MSTSVETVYEAKWAQAARDAYYKEHPENFAGPDMSYPIKDASDVGDAWNLAGHAANPDQVRTKIKAIAARLGLTDGLPDTAKDDGKKESIPTSTLTEAIAPKSRIATIQVRWIEDGARSLNGRIYPRDAIDRLIASAQRKLTDASALPLTCFLSHEAADSDKTNELIGRITRVWREGTRGMALIDLADTTAARDALALIAGGYLCTESLRAKNAELKTDPKYDVPIVGGANLELEGIDLTNYPGLEQVARIQQVQIAESTKANNALTEVFVLNPSSVHFQLKGDEMPDKLSPLTEAKLREEGLLPQIMGNSPYMTNDNPQGAYGQRQYTVPPLTDPASIPTATASTGIDMAEAHKRVHDHIANVLDATIAPMHNRESLIPLVAPLTEVGRALARQHAAHLIAAHDEAARATGMKCEGAYGKAKDPDMDGDDDTATQKTPESQRSRQMTEEDAIRLLEAKYDLKLDRKRTETELLQEKIAAMEAQQAKQFEDLKTLFTQQQFSQAEPQRRSRVLGSNVGDDGRYQSPHGNYMREKIKGFDWERLADRTAPLPESVPVEIMLKEFEQYFGVLYRDGKIPFKVI